MSTCTGLPSTIFVCRSGMKLIAVAVVQRYSRHDDTASRSLERFTSWRRATLHGCSRGFSAAAFAFAFAFAFGAGISAAPGSQRPAPSSQRPAAAHDAGEWLSAVGSSRPRRRKAQRGLRCTRSSPEKHEKFT